MDNEGPAMTATNQASSAELSDLDTLRAIVEGTASHTGEQFFNSLVQHLAAAMGTGYAFVAEFTGPLRAKTLGYWKPTGLFPSVEWDLAGTPCEDVVSGKICHYPTGVREKFPTDEAFVQWGIESYLGVPLIAADGKHLGHVAVF